MEKCRARTERHPAPISVANPYRPTCTCYSERPQTRSQPSARSVCNIPPSMGNPPFPCMSRPSCRQDMCTRQDSAWELESEMAVATVLAWGSVKALVKEDAPGTGWHRPRRAPQLRLCQTCTCRSGRRLWCNPLCQSTACSTRPENSLQCGRCRCPYPGPDGKYMAVATAARALETAPATVLAWGSATEKTSPPPAARRNWVCPGL